MYMYKNTFNFNSLEFNLYKLLDIPQTSSCQDASKAFKKIVKKFHPDKITKLEEKIYENIVIANQILTNEKLKQQYDNWLLNTGKSHNDLKNDFKDKNLNQYFPKNKREATNQFLSQSQNLRNRHGIVKNDNKNLDSRLKNLNSRRNNLQTVQRESHLTNENFNDTFQNRKQNGTYSDKIVKLNDKITPYQKTKGKLNYVELSDFNKLYVEDSVQTADFTSLDRAFMLQPNLKTDKNIDGNLDNENIQYENMENDFMNLNII